MLNEERVITMTKMAMYESGNKKKNLKVTSYYRLDYITFQTIMSLLWGTVGYVILAAAYLFMDMDALIEELSFELIYDKGIFLLICYIISMIIWAVIAVMYYGAKYHRSLKVTKQYYQSLGTLNAEYKKEN